MGWTKTRSEIALLVRQDPAADTTELRRRLRAERLEMRIEQTLTGEPAITKAQRRHLAKLLLNGHADA